MGALVAGADVDRVGADRLLLDAGRAPGRVARRAVVVGTPRGEERLAEDARPEPDDADHGEVIAARIVGCDVAGHRQRRGRRRQLRVVRRASRRSAGSASIATPSTVAGSIARSPASTTSPAAFDGASPLEAGAGTDGPPVGAEAAATRRGRARRDAGRATRRIPLGRRLARGHDGHEEGELEPATSPVPHASSRRMTGNRGSSTTRSNPAASQNAGVAALVASGRAAASG